MNDPAMMSLTSCFEQKTENSNVARSGRVRRDNRASLHELLVSHTFDGYYIIIAHDAHFIEDVRLPIFVLGGVHAGLFFLLRDSRPDR